MTELEISWSKPEEALIQSELSRILSSASLAHAERLGRFLKFVVNETLAQRSNRLNQFSIAVDVFDRDENFDPAIDAIVRVEAGRLRSKLLEYYDAPETRRSVQIKLPKRSYACLFHFLAANEEKAAAQAEKSVETFPVHDFHQTPLLTEPTIAVLPFVNMSPDPEQDYFADGFTEDLITDLSMLPGIALISRQSTFTYKGKPVTTQQVCQELKANLVLEGSVRKVGNTVRITAQLIEGSTGKHLWAQRYDRQLDNIFEIQDEVNQKIVKACSLKLTEDERQKHKRHDTQIIAAYDYLLRGLKESNANTIEGSARARYCFESALELDPDYASAYARLALNYIFRWIQGWNKSADESLIKGLELANRAVELDSKLALAHAALCWTRLWNGEHDAAITAGQLAIEFDPNEVTALERLALCLSFSGQAELSLPLIDKARHLNPNGNYDFSQGIALYMLKKYKEAIKLLAGRFQKHPNFIPVGLYLTASHFLLGNTEEAALTVKKIKQANPDYNFETNRKSHFKKSEDRKRFTKSLQQAGF